MSLSVESQSKILTLLQPNEYETDLLINPLHRLKPNTKTQNIFCRLKVNLTTFLYTLIGATRKQKERKKSFLFEVYTKVKCYQKK